MKIFALIAAFIRGLFSLRTVGALLFLGTVFGFVAYSMTSPPSMGASSLNFDHSGSVGNVAFKNLLLPSGSGILARVPLGTPTRVEFVGGDKIRLLDEPLTLENRARAQSTITNAQLSKKWGSDITPIVLHNAIDAKRESPGARVVVFYVGDALDDRLTKVPPFTPGQLNGVEVYLFFPKSSSSLLKTTLEAAGAKIVVAQTQTEVDAATDLAISGETPQRARTRKAALGAWMLLMSAGLFALVLPVLRARRNDARQRAQAQNEAKARAQAERAELERKQAADEAVRRAREAKNIPIKFAPQSVPVTVQLVGSSRSVTRSLRVGQDDSILIAGDNAAQGDLTIPSALLEVAPNSAARVYLASPTTLTVFNLGESPLGCQQGRVLPGESITIALEGGWLMFSDAAEIEFTIASVDGAKGNAAAHNGKAGAVAGGGRDIFGGF